MVDHQELADRISRNVHLVRSSEFIPVEPTDLQWAFLCDDRSEVLFGGGGGSGKSVALLADALKYAHVPGYSALLIRRTYPDLAQPGGLMSLAAEWLTSTSAKKIDGGKAWLFPSGATLRFGHMENAADMYRFQGGEYQMIGWDEVAQMEADAYHYLQTRRRRSLTTHPELADVPLRTKCTANPGGKHALWVKEYFISDERSVPVNHPDRGYLHSTMKDNPHLDQHTYAAAMAELNPVLRAQMQSGDWEILPVGNLFAAENFLVVDGKLSGQAHRVRSWDLAGSAKKASDYCAGVLMARDKNSGVYRIEHVVHGKYEPGPLEQIMRQTAELDGRDVPVLIEEERAGSGKLVLSHMRRTVLKGFKVRATRPVGDKVTRAGLLSALVDRNEVELTRAGWNEKFVAEAVGFPGAAHDDMLDAAAQAAHHLARLPVRNQSATSVETVQDGDSSGTSSSASTARAKYPGQAGIGGRGFLVGTSTGGAGVRRDPWGNGVRNRIEDRPRWK